MTDEERKHLEAYQKKDFEKKFNEYCDSLCAGDESPEFEEFVKSNVSDEYKYTHPYWEKLVNDIFDTIEFYCDLLVKYSKEYDYEAEREKENAYSMLVQEKCQLYYDFIMFRHCE